MRTKILGLPVDILSQEDTLALIEKWIKSKPAKLKLVVTAYSEFFVRAQKDLEFARIVKGADLVTADGKSVLAADYFLRQAKDKNVLQKMLIGLKAGKMILSGEVGESVTGVWLFDEITKKSAKNNWKVFLLGGWEGVSEKAAEMLLERFPGMRIAWDAGEERVGTDPVADKRVVKKINDFKPDFLFVQYSPVVQEKWIDSHKEILKAGVAVGIGGTLDEYVGRLATPPKWMLDRGLKWLWRLWLQPKRWRRMIDAVIVFPYIVFRSSI